MKNRFFHYGFKDWFFYYGWWFVAMALMILVLIVIKIDDQLHPLPQKFFAGDFVKSKVSLKTGQIISTDCPTKNGDGPRQCIFSVKFFHPHTTISGGGGGMILGGKSMGTPGMYYAAGGGVSSESSDFVIEELKEYEIIFVGR